MDLSTGPASRREVRWPAVAMRLRGAEIRSLRSFAESLQRKANLSREVARLANSLELSMRQLLDSRY